MTKTLFLLFEHAAGYALFERIESEEIALENDSVEQSISKFDTFSKCVTMRAFLPFPTSEEALKNINDIAEGICTPLLKEFLTTHLPKIKKSKKRKAKKVKFKLGTDDMKLASSIQEMTKIPCASNDLVREMSRGIRIHFSRFIKGLEDGDAELSHAQLGLSHHYSQDKVKYSLKREDNMVIQSICLLDTVDKDLNNFYQRIREWYCWHFPELPSLVKDPRAFVETISIVASRGDTLGDKALKKSVKKRLESVLEGKEQAKQILRAAENSIGFEINQVDMMHLSLLATRFLSLHSYRQKLFDYLSAKMSSCAPNLRAVVGEIVGARLISHAGGILNLAKCPASTVQVLGAEKALFRALKTHSNTPKYGLIFHSPFITRARRNDKGKISRVLANKCAMASRIDSFSEEKNDVYGSHMRDQIEARLKFLQSGERPQRNVEVMRTAKIELKNTVKMKRKAMKKEEKRSKRKKVVE